MSSMAPHVAFWLARGLPPFPRSGAGSPPSGPVTFPTSRLSFRVYIALGADLTNVPGTWAWQDITNRCRWNPGIDIRTGTRGIIGSQTPGDMTLRLDNTDGAFTRRNPNSPYYGLLSPNTPIWLQVDAGSGYKTRAEMFVNEWPVRWPDQSGADTIVDIVCGGPLRRLVQLGELKSPLRRAILAANPTAYWSLEDGSDASDASSTLPTGIRMAVNDGNASFGSTGPAGSVSAVDLSGGTASMRAGITGAVAPWAVVLMCQSAVLTSGSETVFTVRTNGTAFSQVSWGAQVDASTGYAITGVKTDGTITGTNTSHVDAASWHCLVLAGRDIGSGQTRCEAYVDGTFQAQVVAVGTPGAPTEIVINRSYFSQKVAGITGSVCHVAVFSNISADTAEVPDFTSAMNAYVGELAHERITRLCAEESVPLVCHTTASTPMGAQSTSPTWEELIREAEAVSGGLLYETGFGLGFVGALDLVNAPAQLSLDFAQGNIDGLPFPEDDTLYLVNKWRCTRPDGGEGLAELTTGPMGTATLGVFEDSVTTNVETDGLLAHQAGWRVHRDTIDEDRWSEIGISFTRNPDLIDTVTAMSYGARMRIANPPAQMPPGDVDVVVIGTEEHLDPKDWKISFNTLPASLYRVHVVESDEGNLGRVDSDDSYLVAAIGTGDTSLEVGTPTVIWDTAAPPFDIGIGGEQMTVTAITGANSPQTFTVTRSVNGVVKSHAAWTAGNPTPVSLWNAPVYALVG